METIGHWSCVRLSVQSFLMLMGLLRRMLQVTHQEAATLANVASIHLGPCLIRLVVVLEFFSGFKLIRTLLICVCEQFSL